ncbi:hypothetical protein CR513_19346, partial [Mucuna pruriens]
MALMLSQLQFQFPSLQDNSTDWSIHVSIINLSVNGNLLRALDLWEAVEEDYEVPPLPSNPTAA